MVFNDCAILPLLVFLFLFSPIFVVIFFLSVFNTLSKVSHLANDKYNNVFQDALVRSDAEWLSGQGSQFPEMTYKTGPRFKICLLSERLLLHIFEPLIALINNWAQEAVFPKNCQDVLKQILRHPRIYISMTRDWGGVEDTVGMGTGGLGMSVNFR